MKIPSLIILACGMILLFSCENPVTLRTEVYEDGTVDKAITFEKKDSAILGKNFFNVSAARGWAVTMTPLLPTKANDSSKSEYRVEFSKHFNSVDEMNTALNSQADTLFNIKSSFEKKFRGFYTYIVYSETFMPINRFKMLPATDYINQEDFQFIERLPGEGNPISKADSVYLQMLNIKIEDHFGNMAIFKEQYEILTQLIKRSNLDSRWLDTIRIKRNFIYDLVFKMEGDGEFALRVADTLGIPLPRERAIRDEEELSRDFDARLSFMSFAKAAPYTNIIAMPWEVVDTNADSVSGNQLFWRPLSNKFMFTEYVMYAESRRLNVWFSLIAGIVFLLTLFVWLRKKR